MYILLQLFWWECHLATYFLVLIVNLVDTVQYNVNNQYSQKYIPILYILISFFVYFFACCVFISLRVFQKRFWYKDTFLRYVWLAVGNRTPCTFLWNSLLTSRWRKIHLKSAEFLDRNQLLVYGDCVTRFYTSNLFAQETLSGPHKYEQAGKEF